MPEGASSSDRWTGILDETMKTEKIGWGMVWRGLEGGEGEGQQSGSDER